ncbi:MAG: Pyridoxamine 5'-phosphate oxidase [Syntrophaceae bacterium PtaB.Bin038]|jgi:nitroimidazol reductase NimA-like FMN-containing flavoprotein (pyridoxamine 5'-phosphate oxidase superfamily)|nr:MAG: Pyridoxamine 5'-phosphate oxidase [Syntrophaceae bacterium PtaB.Bin038]
MRRREREIQDEQEIRDILQQAPVCRLGLSDGRFPYVVPMSFGMRNGRLYLHSAGEGKKIDLIRKNNRVCFEVDVGARVAGGDSPCRWSMKYRSVIGFGTARLLEDGGEKRAGLDAIMAHYGGPEGPYDGNALDRACVIEITIESMTGKQSL